MSGSTPVLTYLPPTLDREVRIRVEWGRSLKRHMEFAGVDPKGLVRGLKELGITVSRQAVCAWIAGDYSPRPSVQEGIGTVLGMPARSIFPLENLPAKAS